MFIMTTLNIVRRNMKYIKRVGLVGVLALGLMLTLAACGGTDTSAQPTATAPAAADSGSGSTTDPTQPPATGGGSGTTIQAVLKEWSITLSQSEASAGKVTFSVTNEGMMAHNLTVLDSSGQQLGKTSEFRGDQGAQALEVDLQPGTYTIICSLPGHAARGQTTNLVVK
jgi:uncharacterized cupredoxin-like copper-binding protein